MLRFIAAAALVVPFAAQAQQTIKIGMINVLSGQFADAGAQLDNGAKTYMKMHGDTVAGKKNEIIRRDLGATKPHSGQAGTAEPGGPGQTDPLSRLPLPSHPSPPLRV